MSTVSLGPTMPMLTVELTRNRPWRSRKGVALRSQSGTTMPWPAAPQLIFSNGTTVGFALSSDSLLATPATALSSAQVDEIIDSGSAIISLIDPGSGVPWAHGRYSVHYGAGTGGTGIISTSGESVVIIADRIEVIGGGGGGGLTQAQAEEVARDAVGAALVAGAGIGIAVDDAADTITITNTAGDQTLPTWSTIDGKPAVVAEGATQAAARTAIGAGTSSFTGTYADLSGKPTLGTAAATASTDYATAAQGALAATALQVNTAQPINAQTGASYTLVASDAGKLVTLTNENAITLTVPGSVLAAGQRVDVMQEGAGAVTVVGSGVTLLAPPGMTLVSEGQNAVFTILFVAPTVAVVAGWMVRA